MDKVDSMQEQMGHINRVLPREPTGYSKYLLQTRDNSAHGHHQMINAKIRLIMFFAAKERNALYNLQKKKKKMWS